MTKRDQRLLAKRQRCVQLADYLKAEFQRGKKKGKHGTIYQQEIWAAHPDDEHAPPENNYCGTTACAGGHAAMMPEFRRLGLRIVWQWYADSAWDAKKGEYVGAWKGLIRYRGQSYLSALQMFFGMTDWEARHTFGDGVIDRRTVIARLRKVAAATDLTGGVDF